MIFISLSKLAIKMLNRAGTRIEFYSKSLENTLQNTALINQQPSYYSQ